MEVLISVAVLSLILAASFAVANRSSQANRQALERSQALKQAESQIELLKKYIPDKKIGELPTAGSSFCLKVESSGEIKIINLVGAIPDDANGSSLESYAENGTNTSCKISGDLYFQFIKRGAVGAQENTYTAYIRWNAVTGHGVDQSTMIHIIYYKTSLLKFRVTYLEDQDFA